MSYGEEAELTARALLRLLEMDALPVSDTAVTRVLACREGLLNTTADQLHHLGADARVRATSRLNVKDVGSNAVNLLHQIVREAPRVPAEQRIAPSDALAAPPEGTEPVVELWRQAAAASTAATHDLTTARLQPWLHDRAGGWYLVRDLANTVEALVVLDTRMAEVGLLPHTPEGPRTLSTETRRLVAAHSARVAGWQATSMSPDLATAHPADRLFSRAQVQTVEQPADLASAQRGLAVLLRLCTDRHIAAEPPGIDITAARAIATGQAALTNQFTIAAALGDRTTDAKETFRTQHLHLADVQARLAPLTDIEPRRNRRLLFQQQEIGQALRRFTGHELSPAQMLDLAEATHTVSTAFASALRQELHDRRGNIQVLTVDGYRQVPPMHPISQALLNLADTPPPRQPVARWPGPQYRSNLRATLDTTPTGRRRTPYPATTFRRAPTDPSAPGR